jgi:hypothetical protein
LPNSQWNDTISCSNSNIRVQLCEQNGGDYIVKSTLEFANTTQLNQTIEIGNIQFTNPTDSAVLATANFKYALLPIENLHKQLLPDENNKIPSNQVEEIKVDQPDPVVEETNIEAKDPVNSSNENQFNEREPEANENGAPILPIAKEETIDEAIMSSNIGIDDEKTNVITHSSRDKFPSVKGVDPYEHGCIILKVYSNIGFQSCGCSY